MKVLLKSLAETKKVAEEFAQKISTATIFILNGELGSGKTTFTKYLALALGYTKEVSSPTFALHQTFEINHKGKIFHFHHLDLYRIKENTAWHDLFYFFELEENFVAVIEWGEKVQKYIESLAYPLYILTFYHHPEGRLLEIEEK